MKYSKATNYALHTMIYLASVQKGKAVGVEQLASIQKLSPTYLSKILTKLVKAGLIESAPGVNGGYRISRKRDKLSFLDVIQAIEGSTTLFHCSLEHPEESKENCLIETIMLEVEENMRDELNKKYIIDIANEMNVEKIHLADCPKQR